MQTHSWRIILSGDTFLPQMLEGLGHTGLSIERKAQKGEIGDRGRFRGKPYPHGSCIVTGKSLSGSEFLAGALSLISEYESLHGGIPDKSILLTVAHEGQGNFEIDGETIQLLARVGLPLSVTCYQIDTPLRADTT